MAVTLAESAKLSQDALQRGVIETFILESPVLDRIPFEQIEGNALAYNEELTLPGVAFRAVNTAYVESTGTVNPKSEKLVILGGDADVDTFIVKTRGNLNDQRAVQTRMKVKAAAYAFQDAFINGDTAVDVNSFDGLKKRLAGAQVIATAANGLPVIGATDTDRHAFLDRLDDLLSLLNGEASALYMNASILAKIKSSARRLTIFDQSIDSFGKKIATYNGVPLLWIGKNAAGVEIAPQTETQGTAVGTVSSIYAVRFGQTPDDAAVTGLTNGGVTVRDLGEVPDKPVFRTRIEFFTGLGVFGGKGAARLTGVLNS